MSEKSQESSAQDESQEDDTLEDSQHRRRRRRRSTRWDYIGGIAAVAAVLAVFAPASPTGVGVFDVLERAAFAAIVTYFTACSRRWTWPIIAGTALVFAGSLGGYVFGGIALVLAVHSAIRSTRRDRLTGALIGAFSAQALLRTGDYGFFGFTAIITAIVVGLVVVSGFRTIRRRNRQRILIACAVVAGFTVIASAGFIYSAARASNALESGIVSARRGLNVATDADQIGAAGYWTAAHNSFEHADGILSNPLTKLAYPIPVLSQHARLASVAATSGSNITQTAARAATVAPYERLRAADGTFDLARISAMEEPVEETAQAMTTARDQVDDVTTPWLVGPLRTKVQDYRRQLVRAIPRAEQALDALRVAPEVLGGKGKRRYLLLFANPAETRGLGGFIGSWAQLDADNGRLELVRHGKMNELNDAGDPATRKIVGEPEYMKRYGHLHPARFIQNISASPDFPTVARVAQQLYPQAGGVEVDGVMYLDPIALGALLELTGPVNVDGIAQPLTSMNAANYLMNGQYLTAKDVDDRSDMLSDAAEATFQALTHRELPSISTITRVLSPMMHNRRVMATVTDKDANRYFARIGLTGAFPPPTKGDFAAVTVSNGSANKADFYLFNIIGYEVDRNSATGSTKGKILGLLTNSAPTSGPPAYVLGNQDTRAGRTDGRPFGSTTLQVSVYTALRPTTMTIDNQPVGIQVQRELGYWVSTQTVTVPAGSNVQFALGVEGVIKPGDPYQVTFVAQPTAKSTKVGGIYFETDQSGKRLAQPGHKLIQKDVAIKTLTVR